MQNLIEAVKAYAISNYENDGWDVLVECYEDREIADFIGDAVTPEDAIRNVSVHLKRYHSYRADIEATAF